MQSSWKRAAKARLAGTGFAVALIAGMAAPSVCARAVATGFRDHEGVRRRCLASLHWNHTGGERIQECIQSKIGQLSKPCLSALLDAMAGASFRVCKDQTYALCAAAKCNVFNGVAYCQCDLKHGDSISLPFATGNGEDVCSINAAGADNKYIVSTYSLPEQIASPREAVRSTPVRVTPQTAPTPSATAAYASQAPRRRRFQVSTSPCRRDKSSALARSPRRSPARHRRDIKSSGLTRATSRSSDIARAPPPTAIRVQRSMSAPPIGTAARLTALLNGHAPPLNECGVEIKPVSLGPNAGERRHRGGLPGLPTHTHSAAESPETARGR